MITQCVWTNGPTEATFSYSIAADAWLDIELTATNGSQVLTASRRVRYGSYGGDGPLLGSPSIEGASSVMSSEAEALAVEAFEVAGVRPSMVRLGGRMEVKYALPEASEVEISVRDVLGRVHHRAVEVRAAGRHRAEVPVSSLSAGLYLVTVRAGQAQQTVRFVVQ